MASRLGLAVVGTLTAVPPVISSAASVSMEEVRAASVGDGGSMVAHGQAMRRAGRRSPRLAPDTQARTTA